MLVSPAEPWVFRCLRSALVRNNPSYQSWRRWHWTNPSHTLGSVTRSVKAVLMVLIAMNDYLHGMLLSSIVSAERFSLRVELNKEKHPC